MSVWQPFEYNGKDLKLMEQWVLNIWDDNFGMLECVKKKKVGLMISFV